MTPGLALRLEGLTLNVPYTTEGNVDRSWWYLVWHNAI